MSQKNKNRDISADEQISPLIPAYAAYIAAFLFVAGIVSMYFLGRNGQDSFTWKNYLAIALTVCSAVLWFISGMDRTQVLDWFRSGFIALFLALTIRWAIAEPYIIPSGSMETTLHGDPRFGRGDRVFVNKWIYGLRYPFLNKRIWQGKMPERWDIVVFKAVEPDAVHKTLVKRIVGMPGEEVQIRSGRVYINGTPLTLPESIGQEIYYTSPLDGPYGVQSLPQYSQIPDGHYLLLGDNSAHSRDGRYFGWVPNENMVGRVSSIWWPPPRWRDFTGFSQQLWWRGGITVFLLLAVLRLLAGRICSAKNANGLRGQRCVISFLSYGLLVPFLLKRIITWRRPASGELVLFKVKDPLTKSDFLFLGRIAAVAGERVTFDNGRLCINGSLPESGYFVNKSFETETGNIKYGRIKSKEFSTVPEHAYFLLSDDSAPGTCEHDSRTLGWISEDAIVGKAVFCCCGVKQAD